jgi:hypothetical protein
LPRVINGAGHHRTGMSVRVPRGTNSVLSDVATMAREQAFDA